MSDWLRREGNEFDNTVKKFAEASGHDFTLVSLREIEEVLRNLGFVDIELTNRQDWYLNEATAELEKMRGSLQEQLCEEIEFWEIMVGALSEGAIMPGYIRAMKPSGTH